MKRLIAAAAIAVIASGCVFMGKTNAAAPLVLNVRSPETNFIDNSVKPAKKGIATASGLICFTEGDASIKAAMENGGITKIHHIDYEVRNIFGIIGSTTTIVWGE